MNLGKNVYNLLKRQSEVYIKGLGSFKRNHTPAAYDDKRGVYLPPISYIDFDQTSSKGYDFIQYIAQLHAVDVQDAEQQINVVVHDLLQKIREEGQAKLEDLGYLVSYGEGYVFKALDLSGFNYEPVAADLHTGAKPTIATPSKSEASPIQKEARSINELPKVPVVASEQQPVSAEIMEPFFENNRMAGQRSRSNAIWYILIAVVALSIIGGLYYYSRNQPVRTEPLVAIDSSDNQPDNSGILVPQDTVPIAQDSLAETLADTSARVPEQQPIATPSKKDNWQIVIGSHKTLEQAYEHAASYNKKGYSNVRVIPSNLARNRKKVIWDSYETKEQLDSALQFVQKNVMKDAWPDKIN